MIYTIFHLLQYSISFLRSIYDHLKLVSPNAYSLKESKFVADSAKF